jgi:hypothetical protein
MPVGVARWRRIVGFFYALQRIFAMSQSVEDVELEARVADLLARPAPTSLEQCTRCGVTLVRGAPKGVNSLENIRRTGHYYQDCNRSGCLYSGQA